MAWAPSYYLSIFVYYMILLVPDALTRVGSYRILLVLASTALAIALASSTIPLVASWYGGAA